jgi:predicted kinase
VEEQVQKDIATLRRALEPPPSTCTYCDEETTGRVNLLPRPFLVMLIGLPGTGKSHFARTLAQRVPCLILESDQLRQALVSSPKYTKGENSRVFTACHRLIQEYLAEGRRIIFDATNLMEVHRQPLYHLTDRSKIPLVVVRLTAPETIIRRRLAERTAGLHSDDHSKADWRVYRRMLPTEEPISREHFVVDSSDDIRPALEQIAQMITESANTTVSKQGAITHTKVITAEGYNSI